MPSPTRVAARHVASMRREACIVAAGKFGDTYCLLKNRDRNYLPTVSLVHEVRDGVEVAYLYDESTGWAEGLNEHGVGVVNAALMVSRDESERDEVERTGKKLKDGERILKALGEKTVEAAAKSVRTYKDGLKGHTIVSDGKKTLYVEMPDGNDVDYDEVPESELFVRTNHGVEFPDAGYVEGDMEDSSKSRQEDAEEVLSKVDAPEDVAPALLRAREDRWDPTEMVRDNRSDRRMRTTTQMVLEPAAKKLTLYILPGRVEWKGLDDRMPEGREPKITVEVVEYKDLSEDTDAEVKKKRVAYEFRSEVTPADLAFAENLGLPVESGHGWKAYVPAESLFSRPHRSTIFAWRTLASQKQYSLVEVPLDLLVPCQEGVPLVGLRRYFEGEAPLDPDIPSAVLYEGALMLQEGHTRMSAAVLRGATRGVVRLYVWDATSKYQYRKPTEADLPPGCRIKSWRTASEEGLLPILDPAYNVREVFKQLVLLEDHLFHARKRCPDCIWKHLLTAEALAEEAVTLDLDQEYADVLGGLADRIRALARDVQEEALPEAVAQKARAIRKSLLRVTSQVRVASEGVQEVESSAAFPPFKVGDLITHGKFQNKPGQIVRMFMDERGIPMIEVAPVGHKRRKNRVMGLFRIRHASMAARVAHEWLRRREAARLTQRVFYRGQATPDPLRLNHDKVLWLALDTTPAKTYADPWYHKGAEGYLFTITLKPSARIIDLKDLSDPVVRELKDMISGVRQFTWGPISDEAWPSFADFGIIEGYSWSRKFLRSKRVDGVLVRDSNQGVDHASVALFNLSAIATSTMETFARNPKEAAGPQFGPRQDLVQGIKFRVKSSYDGVLVRIYQGTTAVGWLLAHWSRRAEECQADVDVLRAQHTELAKADVLYVWKAFIDEPFLEALQGKGIGRAMYQVAMAEGFKARGPFLFTNAACYLGSGTSPMAKRVWQSLARQYPSSGDVVAVLRPPAIGLRTAADERNRIHRRILDLEWQIPKETDRTKRDALRDEHARLLIEQDTYRALEFLTDLGIQASIRDGLLFVDRTSMVQFSPGRDEGDAYDDVLRALKDEFPEYMLYWGGRSDEWLGVRFRPKHGRTAAGKYKEKKKVKNQKGEETTVYVYSEKQVEHRHRQKAKRYEALSKDIGDLRKQVAKDIDADDPKTRLTALAVALIDATFERVGNDDSADDGHYGVTGWLKKHVTFGKGKATIKYVGKSGVDHEKVVDDAKLVKALKDCCGDKKPGDALLSFKDEDGSVKVSSRDVNAYLEPFDVTAKDLRGFHANREMQDQLKAVRKKGPRLPEEKKEREKLLKDEFKEALEATAEAVGHEASTLRTQYLVPGLEDAYVKDGTVLDKIKDASRHDKTAIIHIDNATDGEEGSDLRGFHGLVSSLTLYEKAVVEDMDIHGEPIRRTDSEVRQVGWIHPAGTYLLRGHAVDADAVMELVGAGYLAESEPGVFVLSPMFHAKRRLYSRASRVASAWRSRIAATRYVPLLIPDGPRGRVFDVPVEPDDAWIWELPRPPTSNDRPEPGRNVQHADKGHDWTWRGGKFRPAHTGRTGDVWYLLQYGQGGDTVTCASCGKEIAESARFCLYCGTPTARGRQATKSVSEREDEEAERLVKPSPKKKPPRDDSDRRRVQVDDDPDSKRDRDLSLNYKDVGG